ncbi:MAG: HupE/UreJ family protein [Bacteroidota bacterium]
MSEFLVYFQLGFQHISDLAAYDHILFIVALCAVYQVEDWRRILVLVTAFTIGHSITLALATLNIFTLPSELIEFLIPVTILITALFNVLRKDMNLRPQVMRQNYGIALFFGLIHGMGFSNYLRALLGQEESIWKPLLAFNLGLELGQILIVAIIMGLSYVVLNIFKAQHREWNLFISGAAAGIAFILMTQTWVW